MSIKSHFKFCTICLVMFLGTISQAYSGNSEFKNSASATMAVNAKLEIHNFKGLVKATGPLFLQNGYLMYFTTLDEDLAYCRTVEFEFDASKKEIIAPLTILQVESGPIRRNPGQLPTKPINTHQADFRYKDSVTGASFRLQCHADFEFGVVEINTALGGFGTISIIETP